MRHAVQFEFDGERRAIEVELQTVDLSLEWRIVRPHFTNHLSNMDAAFAASRVAYSGRLEVEAAVYVAGKMHTPGCKIGTSSNPLGRFSHMQVGSNPDLDFSALFWTIGAAPFPLERMALKEVGRRGKRVHGEWVSLTADEAGKMIYRRAQERGIPIADSRTHLRNMRAIGIAEHDARIRFYEETFGKGYAAYWRAQNPLAHEGELCQ